jgi:hypothetical protein
MNLLPSCPVVTLPRRHVVCACYRSGSFVLARVDEGTDTRTARRPSAMHGTASVCLFHRVARSPLITFVLDYKFDLMYSKRAFVHWYVGEGMEEVRPYSYSVRLWMLAYSPVG